MIVLGEQQRDSAIQIRVSILPQPPFLSRLPHNIEQSSICYTGAPCWLSFLNIAMCTCLSHLLLFSHLFMSNSLWPHGPQHARLPCSSPTPRACSNSCPLSQSCHPTIASSVIPLSSCLQVFSASGSFQMSQLFTSGGQSIGASTSASVFPMNIQDWFPLGWTGLIAYSVLPNCPFSPTTITSDMPTLWQKAKSN